MAYDNAITTAWCAAIFAEEIAAASGTVSDSFDDGRLLIARSILPQADHVQPDDRLQGGVALHVMLPTIAVHPYVFREICQNGAILPVRIRSRQIVIVDGMPPADVEFALRHAIRACSVAEAFDDSMKQIRASMEFRVERDLAALSLLSRLAPGSAALRQSIVQQMLVEADPTGFALMNAVTAVARKTRDPEMRWRLEMLGGSVPRLLAPFGLPPDDHALRVDGASDLAAWSMLLRPAT